MKLIQFHQILMSIENYAATKMSGIRTPEFVLGNVEFRTYEIDCKKCGNSKSS